MTMTNILSSVFSVLTLFWLVAVLVALIVGLWFDRAGANNAAYDADCEEAYRDLMSRKFTAKKSARARRLRASEAEAERGEHK